jgi:hypothetical protein
VTEATTIGNEGSFLGIGRLVRRSQDMSDAWELVAPLTTPSDQVEARADEVSESELQNNQGTGSYHIEDTIMSRSK